MAPTPPRRAKRTPPPGDTGEEASYLRFLSEKRIAVVVKLRDGESVSGWIEYFDDNMIRLTREGKPNLFIYKNQIRTIPEHGRHGGARLYFDGERPKAPMRRGSTVSRIPAAAGPRAARVRRR